MFQNSKIKLTGLAILALGLVLAACGQPKNFITIGGCPAVGVLSHLGSFTRFNSTSQTSENVIFDASITNLDYTCRESKTIDTTISFSIQAHRGPAMTSDVYNITYIVVVIKDNYQITTKKKFTTQIRFAPGQETAGVRETFIQRFDDVDASIRYDYEVFVGFEMSPEELQFNVVR